MSTPAVTWGGEILMAGVINTHDTGGSADHKEESKSFISFFEF